MITTITKNDKLLFAQSLMTTIMMNDKLLPWQKVLSLNFVFDSKKNKQIHQYIFKNQKNWSIFNQEIIRLNRYNEKHAKCKVFLIIVFQTYIEWCHQMQQNYIRVEYDDSNLIDHKKTWFLIIKKKFESYVVANVNILIDKFWKMFFVKKSKSLMKLKNILKKLIKWKTTLSCRLSKQ